MKTTASTLKFTLTMVAVVFFNLLQGQSPAQTIDLEDEKTYKVVTSILPGSQITINGKTNINSFHCTNCEEVNSYSEQLEVERKGTDIKLDGAFIDIASGAFDCGIKELTKDFKDLLCVTNYPHLTIKIKKLSPTTGGTDNMIAYIDLTIAGTTRPVEFPVCIKLIENKISCQGTATINIEDFNISPPTKFFGMIKVKEHIDVEFDLLLDIQTEISGT